VEADEAQVLEVEVVLLRRGGRAAAEAGPGDGEDAEPASGRGLDLALHVGDAGVVEVAEVDDRLRGALGGDDEVRLVG